MEKLLGLVSVNKTPIPLKEIDVKVNVVGTVAEVQSSLTYMNEEDSPIEASFTFPVDDGSAVYRFEAEIQGRKIVAEIQEREQAKLTYKDSLGKTAALLKQDDSTADVFQCMLGNLPAQAEATLTLAYVIELPQEPNGQLRFTLPTILNPRYSPDAGTTVAAEGATYTPPSRIPYTFTFSADIRGHNKVSSVTSAGSTLKVEMAESDHHAMVTLAEEFKFDHDLDLLVLYENCFEPQIVMEVGKPESEGLFQQDMLMLSFRPDLKEVSMATSGEYIFVIDRSGSMRGDRIKNAKEALLLFLKSLPPDCYFNIYSFGSSYTALFSSGSKKYSEASLKEATVLQEKMGSDITQLPCYLYFSGSKKYSEESLKEATDLQENMNSDMGGTEILKPLQHAYAQEAIQGHPRSMFILTDGEVGNTDQIVALVKKHAASVRVFTLGVGHGASTSLVNGIARAGKGKAEFIADNSRVQPKIISLLKCSMQPAITNVEISWDLSPGVTTMLIPETPPMIVTAGERLTLYALMQGVDQHTIYRASSLTLKGDLGSQPVNYSLPFTLNDETKSYSPTSSAHRLATKAQIKILEDEEASNKDDLLSGYNYYRNKTENLVALRTKIVNLSRHGNIVSKMTAFVAVDKEGEQVEGTMVERPCPVPTIDQSYIESMNSIRRPLGRRLGGLGHRGGGVTEVGMGGVFPFNSSLSSLGYDSANCVTGVRQASSSTRYLSTDCDTGVPPVHQQHSAPECFGSRKKMRSSKFNFLSCTRKKKKSSIHQQRNAMASGLYTADCLIRRSMARILGHAASSTDALAPRAAPPKPPVEQVEVLDAKLVDASSADAPAPGAAPPKPLVEQEEVLEAELVDDKRMMAVIAEQTLQGNWELTKKVADLLQLTQDKIKASVAISDEGVACTLAVLAWLARNFSKRQEEWQMIEAKALSWLEQQALGNRAVADLLAECSKTLWSETKAVPETVWL